MQINLWHSPIPKLNQIFDTQMKVRTDVNQVLIFPRAMIGILTTEMFTEIITRFIYCH